MSTFSVIMLAIVAYFVIGGVIMGLINETFELKESVLFWPTHVLAWFVELGTDLREGFRELYSGWRKTVNGQT